MGKSYGNSKCKGPEVGVSLVPWRNGQEASQCRWSRDTKTRAGEMSRRGNFQDGVSSTRSKNGRDARGSTEVLSRSCPTRKDRWQLATSAFSQRERFISTKGRKSNPHLPLSQRVVGAALALRHREWSEKRHTLWCWRHLSSMRVLYRHPSLLRAPLRTFT